MTSGLRQKLGKCAMPGARKKSDPREAGFAPKLVLKQLTLFFFFTLFVLLVFDIFSDHFRIQAHCVNTVASGPKMITPLGLFFELFIFV